MIPLFSNFETHQSRSHRDIKTLASTSMWNHDPLIDIARVNQTMSLVTNDDRNTISEIGRGVIDTSLLVVGRRADDTKTCGLQFVGFDVLDDWYIKH